MTLYSPIPIHRVWKIPEEKLKKLLNGPDSDKFLYDVKAKVGIADVEYRLQLSKETKICDDDLEEKHIEVWLKLYNIEENKKIYCKFASFVKSANFATGYGSCLYTFDDDEYSDDICSVEELFNAEKKYIVNRELVVEVKGMLYIEPDAEGDAENKCQRSLGQFLWDRDDQDFTIIVGKNAAKAEIKVHKLILAARSPVFNAMINTDMKEKAESKVKIIHFDAAVVKAAVAFCYDQDISEFMDDLTNTCSLFQFANKYDIADLKDILERHLVTELTPENVCEITNAALITNSPKLQDFCLRSLLIFMRQAIPVNDISSLDKNFAKELLEKSFSADFC
uniref:BTB domain-containing protein n=1 Tax=Panagrolaimus sp. ES5 TaxID=591445 RepID=A0AC34FZE7_9BILA